MYANLPYISSVAFVELPYLFAQVVVFVPICYFMIGAHSFSASSCLQDVNSAWQPWTVMTNLLKMRVASVCVDWLAGFKLTATAVFYFFFMFILDLALFTYFGQFLVFLTPSQGLAQILATGWAALQSLQCRLCFWRCDE